MERKQHAAGRGGAQMQECPSIESRCGVGAAHAADASRQWSKLDARNTPSVAELAWRARGWAIAASGGFGGSALLVRVPYPLPRGRL